MHLRKLALHRFLQWPRASSTGDPLYLLPCSPTSATPWRRSASRRALGVWRCGYGALHTRMTISTTSPRSRVWFSSPVAETRALHGSRAMGSYRTRRTGGLSRGRSVKSDGELKNDILKRMACSRQARTGSDSRTGSPPSSSHSPASAPYGLAASRSARLSSPRPSPLGCWGWRSFCRKLPRRRLECGA